ARSRTTTLHPARASTAAATSPLGPDPMTTASASVTEEGLTTRSACPPRRPANWRMVERRSEQGGQDMGGSLSTKQVEGLRKRLSGPVLAPGDGGYDDVRQIHNGMIDKRPALIARCQTATDIADAIEFARDAGLEISVRGGGHNVAGRAVTEGGVRIDRRTMKGIDIDSKAATVRAQPGLTWGEYN